MGTTGLKYFRDSTGFIVGHNFSFPWGCVNDEVMIDGAKSV